MKVKLHQLRIMPFLLQMNRSSKYCQTEFQVKFHEKIYLITRNTHRCGKTVTGTVPLVNILCLIMIEACMHSFIHSTNVCQARGPVVRA